MEKRKISLIRQKKYKPLNKKAHKSKSIQIKNLSCSSRIHFKNTMTKHRLGKDTRMHITNKGLESKKFLQINE